MEGGWKVAVFFAPKFFCLKGLNVLAICFDLSQKVESVFFLRKLAPNKTNPKKMYGDLLLGRGAI